MIDFFRFKSKKKIINTELYSSKVKYLYDKYDYLTKNKMYVNACTKQLSDQYKAKYKMSFSSLLESSTYCCTANVRKNKFYNAVGFRENWRGITIFLDSFIHKKFLKYKSDFNVALIIESKACNPHSYKNIQKYHKEFDLILTYDEALLKRFPEKTSFIPADTINIGSQFFGLNQEHKKIPISHIYSSKRSTEGHRLRHKIVKKYKSLPENFIHFLGSGTGGVRNREKGEFLVPYYFSLAIENSMQNFYFTEKIMDCFISGTVPIYWGITSIESFFDSSGILTFSNMRELDDIIQKILKDPKEVYSSMFDAVKKNFSIAQNYLYCDDIYLLAIIDFLSSQNKLDSYIPLLMKNP